MTTIVLVRHGQTEWNRIERFRGLIDIELNAVGLAQAQRTAIRIREVYQPEAICSSPLKRALQTANAIAELTKVGVEPTPGLLDINYGEWHGLSPSEVRLKWPDQLDAWYKHPESVQVPGGQDLSEVQTRAMSTVISAVNTHPDSTILMVSHTVVLRLILLGILGVGLEHFWQLRQDPCAINIVEVYNEEFSLVTMNDTCHLEELS